MTYTFTTGTELIEQCLAHQAPIWEIVLNRECELKGTTRDEVWTGLSDHWQTMCNAARTGIEKEIRSVGGLIGGDAKKIHGYLQHQKTISGVNTLKAVSYSMAVLEVNASMGQIIAAPTAGSCGIVPGVLISVQETMGYTEKQMLCALLTASATGLIFTRNATVSGAQGGCQAETGTASAMAAAAVVELCGGSCETCLHAAAITIKNILGTVCDPVAGLVECPCEKRNAIGAANAMISADLALAGVTSVIPFDEVVDAMYRVGKLMSPSLRETAKGGLAATPTGKALSQKIFGV